jgi:hypothetical protein
MNCNICGAKAIWIRMKTKEGPEALCDPCLTAMPDGHILIDNYKYRGE